MDKRLEQLRESYEQLEGGLSDNKSIRDILLHHFPNTKSGSRSFVTGYYLIKNELSKGIRTEMEHTNDIEVATEIAKDHLWEDPEYYKKLSSVENINESTQARTLYHMSSKDFSKFKNMFRHTFGDKAAPTPIFFKETKEEALQLMNAGNILYTVSVTLNNTFNPDDMQEDDWVYADTADRLSPLGKKIWDDLYNQDEDELETVIYMSSAAYDIIEDEKFIKWLVKNGYDSFYVSEVGNLSKDKSIGVIDASIINIISKEKI